MDKPAATSNQLPTALIDQYKKALLSLTDTRLVILLGFSSFEEVMKAFLAWRLGCPIDDLPKSVARTPDFLFQLVLVGEPKILQRTKKLAELRNNVAHKFHLGEYETLLSDFVREIFGRDLPPEGDARRQLIIEVIFSLALDIATVCQNLPNRPEYPFPFLSIELTVPHQKTAV